jgi:FKBP-type peptidyl-prolyl cis-trans isomerase SlyD
MQICKNSVVSINFELRDREGNVLEKSEQPISYLHGGYDGIFPVVEQALEGKSEGDSVDMTLEPADAFGEYDAELVRVEARDVFPIEEITVGMQFQGGTDGHSDEIVLYTVTDVADGKVVVDGNHPLAGQTVQFSCMVVGVRPATAEEIAHGHTHGEGGHHH